MPEPGAPVTTPRFYPQVLLILTALTMTSIGAIGGCAPKPPPPPQTVLLKPMSFARQWRTTLSLKNDELTDLFLRDELLLGYTKNGLSYQIRRGDGLLSHADAVPGGDFRLRPPVVLKDLVVYPTTTDIEVFDLAGIHQRTIGLGAAIRSGAIGDRTFVFIGTDTGAGAGRISKYDMAAPVSSPVWQLQSYHGGIVSAPTAHGGILYAASDDGLVYAVSIETRDPIWPLHEQNVPPNVFNARAAVVGDLQSDDNGVYIPTLDGRLYCLNLNSGLIRWQYFAGGPLQTGPVLSVDTVYQIDPKRGLVALDKLDTAAAGYNRNPRWARRDAVQFLSQDDRNTFLRLRDNTIIALDKQTGQEQFRTHRAGLAVFATNPRDGTIYAASKSGEVLAIRPVYQAGTMGELVLNESPGRFEIHPVSRVARS
jgi:outer membrane protein assembly factor BamB